MRSRVQATTREEKSDRWLDCGGVTRKHEAGKGTARRTGTGSTTEMEKEAAGREEEWQQKEEEEAGQRPKKDGGAGQRRRKNLQRAARQEGRKKE